MFFYCVTDEVAAAGVVAGAEEEVPSAVPDAVDEVSSFITTLSRIVPSWVLQVSR